MMTTCIIWTHRRQEISDRGEITSIIGTFNWIIVLIEPLVHGLIYRVHCSICHVCR